MSWVKIDDRAPEHRKLLKAGAEAAWLWVCGLAYANRQLERDGRIPGEALQILYRFKAPEKLAAQLVAVGLWEQDGEDYIIHDYLEWNHSAEEREAYKAKGRERAAKSYQTRKAKTPEEPQRVFAESSPEDDPKTDEDFPHVFAESSPILLDPTPTPTPTPTPISPTPLPRPQSTPGEDLALTPAPESESKRQRKPNPKREPTGNPNHRPLQDHYDAEFRRLRGGEPPPFGGREAGAIKRLLDQVGNDLDRAKRIVSNGLSAQLGNPQTIVSIAADPARWTVAPPVPFQRGGGRQGPPQPDGGYRPEVVTTFDFEA